jgi:surface polysaccharide O-acyltransferase-like enzyme
VERALCAAGFAASVAATAAGTAWAMGRWDAAGPDAAMRGYFTYFLSPTVVAMSLCVFLLFVGGGNGAAPAPPRPFTAFLARVSFGVYLVHPFFLSLVQRAGFRADTAPVWLYLPGTVAAVFALSVATTAALQALRLTRPLVG